jgi:hypothetical protein
LFSAGGDKLLGIIGCAIRCPMIAEREFDGAKTEPRPRPARSPFGNGPAPDNALLEANLRSVTYG